MLFLTLVSLPLLAIASAIPQRVDLETRQQAPTIYTHYTARALVTGLGIEAHVEFSGSDDGSATFVKVRVLSGLIPDLSPDGQFLYHVHTNPVPSDGNCTLTFGHLDPLNVTESITCDSSFPQYCQEGDLSGKHGLLNGTTSGSLDAFGYSDGYLRFYPADFSLLGRSVVIHSSNLTRLACGNITSGIDGTADYFEVPTNSPSTFVKSYPTAPPYNPAITITPFVGSVFPSNATIASLPYPLPLPALSIAEAPNVELTTAGGIPNNVPVSSPAPFLGYPSADWV